MNIACAQTALTDVCGAHNRVAAAATTPAIRRGHLAPRSGAHWHRSCNQLGTSVNARPIKQETPLQALFDRESIRDCIFRCCRGIDRADEDALRSAYWPDAVCRHGAHEGSGAEFIAWVLPHLRSGARSHHLIGNILIELQWRQRRGRELLPHDRRRPRHDRRAAGNPARRPLRRPLRAPQRAVAHRRPHRGLRLDPPDAAARRDERRPRSAPALPTGGRMPDDPLYALLAHPTFSPR